MEGFLSWWREEQGPFQEKRYVTLWKALLLAALPVACCLLHCALQGRRLGEVYLPASPWNDELFYYKQVEGMVEYGYPLGYFGFNESHALKLSFAAWSPVLVFPWVIWGLAFGWNLMSPIVCNIVLMTIGCFLFVWLTRPTWRQLCVLACLFSAYTPFVRYMLSGMPEVICFGMVIVFYGLAISYRRQERVHKLVWLFVLGGVMTWMRPYLAVFLLLPVYFWIRRNGWRALAGSAAVLAGVMGIYAGIKHFLGAEYFAPLFFTDWVEAFFEQGIVGGIRFTVSKLRFMKAEFLEYTRQGICNGVATGAFFAGYLLCMCVLFGQGCKDLWRLRRLGRQEEDGHRKAVADQAVIGIHMLLCFMAMLLALLLMYKLVEGSKHLLTFMAAAVFVVGVMDTRHFKKAAVLAIGFVYLYSYKAVEPYDYQVPFAQQERREAVEEWRERMGELIVLDREDAPDYGNVVIWAYNDWIDGEPVYTPWQLLYGLPKGTGISCCTPDYVVGHFDSLKSRYMVMPVGGKIEALCQEAGYRLLYGDGEMALYEME